MLELLRRRWRIVRCAYFLRWMLAIERYTQFPAPPKEGVMAAMGPIMSISQFDPRSASRSSVLPPNPVASKREIKDRLMPGVDSPLLSSLKLC